MTDKFKNNNPSDDARKAALTLAKKAVGNFKAKASYKEKRYKTSMNFSDFSDYKEIRTMRAAADAVGIINPFFKTHEVRAGATTQINGRELINFASYDYLGMNADKRVSQAAKEAIDQFGTSASASRLVAGERELHRTLEQSLARHYGVEDAIVFVSGHATNVNTIGYLLDEKDLIIHDSYIHNSAMVGAKLSGASRRSFEHNNLDKLVSLLEENRNKYRNALILVEGLYSMDGDTTDIARVIEIKEKFGAWLMVDEAHALGVTGDEGYGTREKYKIDPSKVDIWMGTLSKTLSASGGYIAGSSVLVELLKTRAPGFVYSVGLAPGQAAAANCAINLMQEEPERVRRLRSNGLYFLNLAKELGLNTGYSEGYAVTPILVSDSILAIKLTQRLTERGFNIMPIVYPAVPMKSARLRFFITSEHKHEQLHAAANATREELDELSSN